MASDELVAKVARDLNRKGWTCDGGLHEPGEYDTCADCRELCKDMARAALAVVEAERGWEYKTVGRKSEYTYRRHPASEWEACE